MYKIIDLLIFFKKSIIINIAGFNSFIIKSTNYETNDVETLAQI
jgi:hypothetical protein